MRRMTLAPRVIGPQGPGYDDILTPEALDFVGDLAQRFGPEVQRLLARRGQSQADYDAGRRPDFLTETAEVRAADWKVAGLPPDLLDRRVEITGPPERKMVINALNSGARVFMADFEDANSPTWSNCIEGQINLRDAVRRTIAFDSGTKQYSLKDTIATLMVRPRGWHLKESHVLLDDEAIPASIFDFGLFFFHNAKEQLGRGTGPYFYLPKLQSHLEARLWNDVFIAAQEKLEIPKGTIKATVLIETIPAVFEMDEILYELKDHSAGLNCGRWDYIFSYIKTVGNDANAVLPDRGEVGMTQPFMSAYSQLLIKTCHRRGVHAMGGMAAQIPIKSDPEANELALEKVRQDKLREVKNGHDGTWVAHPGLVPIAMEIFDTHMKGANQLDVAREDVDFTAAELLEVPKGNRTEAGLRQNINVGIQYLAAWLGGQGCVPLYNLMEDAATAEISRTQVWQWVHHRAALDDGRIVEPHFVSDVVDQELKKIESEVGRDAFQAGHFIDASRLFESMILEQECAPFLTLPAYEILTRTSAS